MTAPQAFRRYGYKSERQRKKSTVTSGEEKNQNVTKSNVYMEEEGDQKPTVSLEEEMDQE